MMAKVELYLFNALLIVMLVTISNAVGDAKWNSGSGRNELETFCYEMLASYLVCFDCRESNGAFRLSKKKKQIIN